MPNRIIRAGINRSDKVNALDFGAEVFYRRLLNEVDDHGLFDARLSVLRATLFPLCLDRIREADIQRWIAACVKSGLVRLYQSQGKPYLQVLNTQWEARSKPKYPLPDNCEHLRADENNCAPYSESFVGDGIRDSESKTESVSCDEPPSDSPPEDAVLTFPCVKGRSGKTEWPLTGSKLSEYVEAFPGIDVLAESRRALQWCRDNPAKRKTFDGMPKFLGSWLSRSQNSTRAGPAVGHQSSQNDPRGNFAALAEYRRMKEAAGIGESS